MYISICTATKYSVAVAVQIEIYIYMIEIIVHDAYSILKTLPYLPIYHIYICK